MFGGVDDDPSRRFVSGGQSFAAYGLKFGDIFDSAILQLNSVGNILVGGVDVKIIAAKAKSTTSELILAPCVLHAD